MRRAAFTLVEVLVALALLAMLAGSVFAFAFELFDRRDRLFDLTRDGRSAGTLIEMIESDILCGLAGDARAGAGVAGDRHSLKLLSRCVGAPGAGAAPAAALGGLRSTEYAFDASTGAVEVRRSFGSDGGPPTGERIAEAMARVRFRYLDGSRWSDSFDSRSSDRLPVAIEVSVWCGSPAEFAAGRSAPPDPTQVDPGEVGTFSEEVPGDVPDRVRAPDRTRVIIVPDGPVTGVKEDQ